MVNCGKTGGRMSGRTIQTTVLRKLREALGPDIVAKEWSVRRRASDTFSDVATYAPRLDIAVGPFNVSREHRDRDAERIRLVNHVLVRRLRNEISARNGGGQFLENLNPRCLIAIEIEDSTSSKHILGGITNASMLGLLGVVIGSRRSIEKVRRIHAYARKLKEVGKARPEMFGNVACFTESEFMRLLP